jgi:hypothetical protein
LVLFSLAAYIQHAPKSRNDVHLYLAALAIVPSFFILILALFAPQYSGIFDGVLKRSMTIR